MNYNALRKIKDYIKQICLPLVLYLICLIFLTPRRLSFIEYTIFLLYAIFVFWIVWQYSFSEEKSAVIDSGANRKFYIGLLIFSCFFIIVTRLLLFIKYGEAPLGYDTGFYLKSMDEIKSGALEGHRVFRALLWVPFLWLGVSKVFILHGLYVSFQLLIAGSFYMLAKTLSISPRLSYAAIVLFLFAVSLPQFFAFWWMFYQTELGIAFMLMTLALLYRRSPLALVTGGFGALVHPATFLPLGVALVSFIALRIIYSLYRLIRRRPIEREFLFLIFLAIVAIFTVRVFKNELYEFALTYLRGPIKDYGWFITNFPSHLRQQFTGLYINFELFHLANIYIIPLGILGALLFVFRKITSLKESFSYRLFFIFIFFITLYILAYFPFIYQNRYLIYLDLIFILFAAYPLVYIFQYFLRDRIGRIAVSLLLFGFISYASYAIWNQEPQLFPDELQEIKDIASIKDDSIYAMSTESLYTPWVYAFSGQPVIDPGYLPQNRWNYSMWQEFWYGKSDARRHELLRLYDKPIYVFVGKMVPENIKYKRFIETDSHFIKISPHIWRYDPLNITNEEITTMKWIEENL